VRSTDRILFGLVIILLSVIVLWYGSPARTGAGEAITATVWGFSILFALGFIITSMGLMGAETDYPAFVSGLVLYFIVGALVAVFLYVRMEGIGEWTLYDADTPGFWAHWVRVAATWPLELVRTSGLLGYDLML
jgi:hypothetical protein